MFTMRSALRRVAVNARQYSDSATKVTVKKAAGAFKKDGSIGKEFTPEGSVGGTAQEVGGPFDKDGAIGKQFDADGAIGGTGQKVAEETQKAADGKETKGL